MRDTEEVDDKGDAADGLPTVKGGGRSGIPSPSGSGGWSDGERPGQAGGEPPVGPPPAKETEWGEQDLAHARNAADLAIQHLRSAVDSGRTDVLDQLGWTREQARAFLDRWESMRRLAEGGDPA
ncbi:MAG: hypothetical protein EBZ59_02615, partial [Planctomycetia bacterium]|nr:hypothetical protein [Planctomycetia bacterium]